MVLSLAAGEALDHELQKFMSSVGMLLKLEKDSMEPHWFIGGMMTMTCPVMYNLISHQEAHLPRSTRMNPRSMTSRMMTSTRM